MAPRLGIQSISAQDVPAETREAAISALNLKADRPTIISVAEGSPAAKAGIRKDDVFASLDGEPVPGTGTVAWMSERLKGAGDRPIQVGIERDSQTKIFSVTPVFACSYPIVLANTNQANAFTDGKIIVVHAGILRIAQTDAELALVVGHELAHITTRQFEKHEQNRVAGAVGGAVVDVMFAMARVNTGGAFTRQGGQIGARAFGTEFEKEADYVGAYYAARAGYEVAGAERLWRAMAQEDPKSLVYAGVHPTSPERFVQMEKTTEEIAAKRRRGLPLVPETRTSAVEAQAGSGSSREDAH